MNPRTFSHSRSLAKRDRDIAALKRRLSLAHASRNRIEVTRLTREIACLSRALCIA
jgi:hypothetical protein